MGEREKKETSSWKIALKPYPDIVSIVCFDCCDNSLKVVETSAIATAAEDDDGDDDDEEEEEAAVVGKFIGKIGLYGLWNWLRWCAPSDRDLFCKQRLVDLVLTIFRLHRFRLLSHPMLCWGQIIDDDLLQPRQWWT